MPDKIGDNLYNLIKSFKYAINGVAFCVRYERNMRIHIIACAYVLFFSQFCTLTRAETILLIIICGSVISLEMVNTAIEVLTDKVSPVYHTLAKIAKDVAAGAVFVTAITAFLTGLALFWNITVLEKIRLFFGTSLINSALLIISAVFSLIFIFAGKPRRKAPKNKARK